MKKYFILSMICSSLITAGQDITLGQKDTIVNSQFFEYAFRTNVGHDYKAIQLTVKKISGLVRGRFHLLQFDDKKWITVHSFILADIQLQYTTITSLLPNKDYRLIFVTEYGAVQALVVQRYLLSRRYQKMPKL